MGDLPNRTSNGIKHNENDITNDKKYQLNLVIAENSLHHVQHIYTTEQY